MFIHGFDFYEGDQWLASLGEVSPKVLKTFDIKDTVYFGFIRWSVLADLTLKNKVKYSELPKFPEVRRDLALLVDRQIDFLEIEKAAYETEKNILRGVNLFDVYEGEGIPRGKKSYAVSFILRDDEKTLRDEDIEKIMNKLVKSFTDRLGASLR